MWSLYSGAKSNLRDRVLMKGFPGETSGKKKKNSPANAGDARDMGSVPELGRAPGVGNSNPIQYACLENSMDRGTWWATAHEVTELDTTEWLSTYILTQKRMALLLCQTSGDTVD